MSPGSNDKGKVSTDKNSTTPQAEGQTGAMSEDEFLKILLTTRWPVDLSDEPPLEEEGEEEPPPPPVQKK